MGYILGILLLVAIIFLRVSYRGATFRPTRFRFLDDICIVTIARNAFQTQRNREHVVKRLNALVLKGWHDLILDLTGVEPCAKGGSIEPLRVFLDSWHRYDSVHVVLVCPSLKVKNSYQILPLPRDVPIMGTVTEALAYMKRVQAEVPVPA